MSLIRPPANSTFDDLANANLGLEVSTALGGIESSGRWSRLAWHLDGRGIVGCRNGVGGYTLLPSKVGLLPFGLIVKVPGVLDGDFVSSLRLVGAIALGNYLPSDTHFR